MQTGGRGDECMAGSKMSCLVHHLAEMQAQVLIESFLFKAN